MTSIYKEGTVTVTNGSYIVDGFNTRFKAIADVKPGDLFTVDGSTLYEIYLVESDTRLRIRGLIQGELYNGGNLTGSNYAIIRNFSSDTDATVAANVIALQQKWHRRENEMYGWFNAETEFATVTSIDGEQIQVITPYGINALVGGPVNTDEFAFTIDGSSELTDLNAFLNGVYYTIEATLTNQPDDFGAGKKLVFTQADVNGFYQKIMDLNTGRQNYRVGVDVESATQWLQVNNGTALVALEQRVFNNEQALPNKLDTTTFAAFSATAITNDNVEATINGLPIANAFSTLQSNLSTNDTISRANTSHSFLNGYSGTLQQYVADNAGGGGGGDITQAYYDANTVTFDNLSANVNGLSVITSLVSTQTALTNNGTIAKANSAATKADAAELFINGQTGTIQDLLSNYAQSSALSDYVTQASYDANAITRDNLETEVNALGISGAATIAIETIANAGASQTINKTANSVIDMTLTQATTSITCATRSDAKAHTVTLILRQGSGANEVSWSGVAWPEGSPPLLTFESGKFDVIELIVTQSTVVGLYKGGWFA